MSRRAAFPVLVALAMLGLAAVGFSRSAPTSGAALQEGSPAATPCAAGSAADSEALAIGYLDAFAAGDVDALGAVLDPSYVHHWGIGDDSEGAEATIARIEAFVSAYTGLSFEYEQTIVAGDDVVVRWILTGTQVGPLGDIAPTGEEDSWTGVNIFRVECGLLVEGWSEADHFGRLRRLGVVTDEELADAATPTP